MSETFAAVLAALLVRDAVQAWARRHHDIPFSFVPDARWKRRVERLARLFAARSVR